jgi:CHASE3 domain sensor protein
VFKRLFALLIIAVISIITIYKLYESFAWVNHTHNVIYQLHNLHNDIFDSQTSIREGIFAANPEYFRTYLTKRSMIEPEIDNLEWMTQDNKTQQRNIFLLRKNIDRRLENFRISYDSFYKGKVDDSKYYLLIGFGSSGTETTRQLVENIEKEELRLLSIRLKNYQQKFNFVNISISLFIIFYLIIFNIKE